MMVKRMVPESERLPARLLAALGENLSRCRDNGYIGGGSGMYFEWCGIQENI